MGTLDLKYSAQRYAIRRLFSSWSLLLPALLYLAVTLYWQSAHFYTITGDEPHYLLIADSLIHDFDLRVENNYYRVTPVHQAVGLDVNDARTVGTFLGHTRNQFSIHNVGVAVLLAPAYALASIAGAKIWLSLIAGLWPLLIYRAVFQITEARRWSLLIALTCALGLPFLAASSQIYPDLLGGMLIFGAAELIIGMMRGTYGLPPSWWRSALVGLLIGFLPWLHVRLFAPALLLFLGYIYASAFAPRSETSPGWYRVIAPLVVFGGSLVLLGFYNYTAYRHVLGPWQPQSLTYDVRLFGMVLLGLHWDQFQGMFVQQPFLLLGLFGLASLVRVHWRVALLLGLVYVSILLPNSMHYGWYGRVSFAGRFGWPALALWIFPLAYGAQICLRRHRTLLVYLCLASVIIQGYFASKWLASNMLLDSGAPIWTVPSLFDRTGLVLRLPIFHDFNKYRSHAPNYVFVALGLLLIATGWLWRPGRGRLIGGAWVVALLAGASVIALAPPAVRAWVATADRLPSEVGTLEGADRIASESANGAGYLTYGPYIPLLAGHYQVLLEYELSGSAGQPIAEWDIVYDSGRERLAHGSLSAAAPQNRVLRTAFAVDEALALNTPFEFRVFYTGAGDLRVKRLIIKPLQ